MCRFTFSFLFLLKPSGHSHYKSNIHWAQPFPTSTKISSLFSFPCTQSVCFLSTLLFSDVILFTLYRVSSPTFPSASLHHPASNDAADGDDVHDEVDGRPVADGVFGRQQHEAHAHVVVGPHLQEPVNPVEDALPAGAESGADGRLHGRLRCDTQRDGEEGEVVARVKPVPVGADQHGPAGPESDKQRGC